ncbi:MAG: endo-1,4-beta-xylanase [Treponema sp.]|nr:endo-1,4-beta-xylanase [Treponema sp.]
MNCVILSVMKTKIISSLLVVLMIFIGFSSAACKQDGDRGPQPGVLVRIEVTTEPAKLEYAIDDQFDPAGMVVTAFYSDNTSASLESDDYTVSGFSSTVEGEKTITVTHTVNGEDFKDFFTITIIPNVELGQPGTGVQLKKETLTLTIGAKEKLEYTVASDAPVKSVTWTSSALNIVSVSNDGTVKAFNFSSGGSNRYNTGGGTSVSPTSTPATGTATITVETKDKSHKDTIVVTATTAGQADIMSLPPLKDQFKDYFLIGNIFRGSSEISGTGADATISNTQLTHHFNALTAENNMKPSYLVTGHNNGTFTWSNANQITADNFVTAANNSGMKVIGHTLLWHSQNPNWVWDQIASKTGTAIASPEQALAIMRDYITAVASRYAGKIYSWDVLNEAFPDNASSSSNWKDAMRKGAGGEGQDANPWYIAIGSDFVYEGFLAARKADPNAILYYNDYNTDMVNRARLIHDMVKDVNDKYLSGADKPAGEAAGRLLIEGIGMQEHHNFSVTAAAVRNSISEFRKLNVTGRNAIRLSVSELDIIAYDQYNDFTNAGGAGANQNHDSKSTNQQLLTQATRYSEYMKIYIENADIIERVSLWGVTDNFSWRSRGLPLLFDHAGKAKPSYYSFVGALE